MEVAPELVIPKVRCAPFHGSQAADPIGSAGAYDAFLCVEVPRPWDKDITLCEPFRSLTPKAAAITAADGRRWRPMGLVPEPGSTGQARVLAFEPTAEPSSEWPVVPLRRRAWSVATEDLVGVCRSVLDGHAPDTPDAENAIADLFVCTHGRRDTCCGSLGAAVHQELQGLLGPAPRRGDGAPVHLARCSHTGGHRFAPTALTFPDGYAWAHLTAELAGRIVRRDGEPAEVAAHCRGSSLIDGAPAQAADRAALVEVGWAGADAPRRARVVGFERDTMATTVRVEGRLADGRTPGFEVRVEVERHIPMPTCGSVDGPEFAVEAVWGVTAVDRIDQ
jgi:hypothetical protein